MGYKDKTSFYFLYCALILLPIYQDSPLSLFLGAAGYTLIMPLSFVFYFLIVFFMQMGKTAKLSETRNLFLLGIWLFLISILGIIVWMAFGNSMTVLGEVLPVKAIKVLLQYFSFPLYVYSLVSCTIQIEEADRLFKPVLLTLFIITAIALVERIQIPYAFKGIHFAGTFPYYRARLLTTESSYTGMQIYCYSAVSIYYGFYCRKKRVILSALICAAILVLTSGSRSVLLSLVLVMFCYLIIAGKKLNKMAVSTLFLALILLVCFIVFAMPRIVSITQSDLSNYTSVATRLYTAVLGLGIGCVFPLGVGCAVYMGILQYSMQQYLWLFDLLPIRLNTAEIQRLITSGSDEALAVKSGILHYNIYWGILGTIFLLKIFGNVSKQLDDERIPRNEILRATLWGAVLMLIISTQFQFEFWMMFGILYSLSIRKPWIGKIGQEGIQKD